MPIVAKAFTITTSSGTAFFHEGKSVNADMAKKYPQFMEGYMPEQRLPHDPSLPEKLPPAKAEKLSNEKLTQWLAQYHPAHKAQPDVKRAELLELVKSLQE